MQIFKRAPIALLIAVLAAVLVAAAMYFLLVGPKKGAIDKKQKEIEAVDQKIQTEKATYRELLDIKNRSAEYEAKLAYLQSIIPEDPGLPSLIRNLQAAADPGTGAGLPWLSFTPAEITTDVAGATYSSYTFSMRVGGFYDQVVDLIYRIERFPRAVVINNVNITSSTGFLQRTYSQNLGVVQAEIQAKAFTFATPTGAAAPSAPSTTPAPGSQPETQPSEGT